jgi:hypothetical protein
MNAKEIRIGNWMLPVGILNISQEPTEITSNIMAQICHLPNAEAVNFKPIPLTEEWLMKFGFKLTISNKDSGYKQYGINKNGFDIMFSIDCNCCPECFIENIGIEITYVHQLQNVFFALCGEELTIK